MAFRALYYDKEYGLGVALLIHHHIDQPPHPALSVDDNVARVISALDFLQLGVLLADIPVDALSICIVHLCEVCYRLTASSRRPGRIGSILKLG